MLTTKLKAAREVSPAWNLDYAYYDDPFAWDISTLVFRGSFSVATQDTNPWGMFFSPDGTNMYFVGSTGVDINQYSLSTPWLVTSASYVTNFSVNAQEIAPRDVHFSTDGTKMYVIGHSGDDVNQYDLTTAWDISTASYTQNFSVSAQDTAPTGLFFKPDGTKMYVTGDAGNDVNEYSLTTAWDISTASYVQNFSVSGQTTTPSSLYFSPDGTRMYLVDQTSDQVEQYGLSTAWDISSASFVRTQSVATEETAPRSVFFKPDGGIMYVLGALGDDVNQYSIGGLSVASQDTVPTGLFFKPDGTEMYFAGNDGDDVTQYSLTAAWDLATASFTRTFSVSAQDTFPLSATFKPDGTKMYVGGDAGNDVNEYSLSTAWNISTASYVQNFVAGYNPRSPRFKPDGTKMFLLDNSADEVKEYSLSTPWDVSTASFVQGKSVTAEQSIPNGIEFSPDGYRMYVCGQTNNAVSQYTLSTPWDISTASYVREFYTTRTDTIPNSVVFKPDGTKLFVLTQGKDLVITYSLGVQS